MMRILSLIAALLVAGCGEAERPRFIPASATDSPPAGTPSKSSREVAVPRNIETH